MERYLSSRPHLSPRTVKWYRGLAVDEIALRCIGERVSPILRHEQPVPPSDDPARPLNLVHDLGHEGWPEALGLAAEPYVEVALPVEAHHPVETGATEEHEVERVAGLVEGSPTA